jgi:uncharacterized protein (UPF0332 family)
MNPRDFQSLSQELLQVPGVARHRAAIGRAYYATFNVAAALLRDAGFRVPESAAAHLEVTRVLKASANKEVERVGAQIENMRGLRNKADYQMAQLDVERAATAATVVAGARLCIDTLDACFSGSNRAAIVASMQA